MSLDPKQRNKMNAQAACEALLEKYKLDVGDRYFKAQFTTNMVPLIYIKFAGAKMDSKPSELVAAKKQVQYMIYGFNADGTLKDSTVTASPSTAEKEKLSNVTGTLEHVMNEICKELDKYIL
jgi:hypothetical protein